jgi:hypothetical protein
MCQIQARRNLYGTRPLFLSPGHLIDLKMSIEIVLSATGRYRIPEPIRRADKLSREIKLSPLLNRSRTLQGSFLRRLKPSTTGSNLQPQTSNKIPRISALLPGTVPILRLRFAQSVNLGQSPSLANCFSTGWFLTGEMEGCYYDSVLLGFVKEFYCLFCN